MGASPTIICMLCGCSEQQPRLQDGKARVVSCVRCGLAWRVATIQMEPDPTGEPIRLQDRSVSPELVRIPAEELPDPQMPDRLGPELGLAEIEEINSLKEPPGALLNIGKDSVDIQETARMYGWQVQAKTDFPASLACAAGASNLGSCGTILTAEPDSYDVLRLEGALEISPDPKVLIQNAARLLGPKGLLVISAADFKPWDYPLWGQGASLLALELPRWYFTPKTFSMLLRQCGFTVLKISTLQDPSRFRIFAGRAERLIGRHLRSWDVIHPPQPTQDRYQPTVSI